MAGAVRKVGSQRVASLLVVCRGHREADSQRRADERQGATYDQRNGFDTRAFASVGGCRRHWPRCSEVEAEALRRAWFGVYGAGHTVAALFGLDGVRPRVEEEWAREWRGSDEPRVNEDARARSIDADDQGADALFGV
jgi:hypothetical protein